MTTAPSLLDSAGQNAWFWLTILALGLPWVHVTVAPWQVYPGHLALSLLLAVMVINEGTWLNALNAFSLPLGLGGFVAAMAAVRGQWLVVAATLGTLGLQFAWGVATYRLAQEQSDARPLQEGVAMLLGASLVMGLLSWGVHFLWPPGCRVLACVEGTGWPYAWSGGWTTPGQYLLFLVFLLPPVAEPVILLYRQGGKTFAYRVLLALVTAAGLAALAGATLAGLAVMVLGTVLLARLLHSTGRASDRRLVAGLATSLVFGTVVVYGLFPGYLGRLVSGTGGDAAIRVTLMEPPPRQLFSTQDTPLHLRVINTGWADLDGETGQTVRIGARLLLTPEKGRTRIYDAQSSPLPRGLEPGQSQDVTLAVRIPAWIREGYLTWRAENDDGHPIPLSGGSSPGFRFRNPAYRRLDLDPDNRLTTLMQRARAYQRTTHSPPLRQPDPHGASMVTGDVLDTLFFSPLWGERASGQNSPFPFGTPRPFFPELFHQYGLIGLLLASGALWRLYRRTRHLMAQRGRGEPPLGWMLATLSLVLLFAAGWCMPEVGSYHAVWAFFLLAGWIEGRHARAFPQPKARSGTMGGFGNRFHLPFRLRGPQPSNRATRPRTR